jgi:S1-C subfamily serine protease
LQEWYRAYVETFQQDRSGTKAFEVAFGRPASEVEREWRKWVIEQPEINLRVRPENAALGIRTSTNGSNDGVLITEVVSGSAAALARLRKGDIIVAIDDRSTRSLMDLRKIIASRNNGDEVHVRVRRNGEYLTATAKLRPVPNG